MPGALPALRMRRDAPRPSVVRGNAVNSMAMLGDSFVDVCGLPLGVPGRPRWSSTRGVRVKKPKIIATSTACPEALGPAPPRRRPCMSFVQRVAFVDIARLRQAVERLSQFAVHDADL